MVVHGSTCKIISLSMAVHNGTMICQVFSLSQLMAVHCCTLTGFAQEGGQQADFGALLKALHCIHNQWHVQTRLFIL
jgi:hypothetical protein